MRTVERAQRNRLRAAASRAYARGMRNGRCDKCGGSRVATTSYSLYLGAGVAGPTIDLYACADCHYVEQYMHDSVESRVKLLDSWRWVKEDEGPFR